MKKITYLLFGLSICLFACKRNYETPDTDKGYNDFSNFFQDTVNNGSGGNGGGSGSGNGEYFFAEVDGGGVSTFSDILQYQSLGGISENISGTKFVNSEGISFGTFGTYTTGSSYALDGFPESATYSFVSGSVLKSYTAYEGVLEISFATPALIEGTFNFNGTEISNGDTIRITNGAFRVFK